MSSSQVVNLAIPRVVTGVARRCRSVERHAVHDPVPVMLRAPSREEAPVALRLPPTRYARQCYSNELRAFEGRFYRPLDYESCLEGITPEAFGQAFVNRLGRHLGRSPADRESRAEFVDWHHLFDGVSTKRGLATEREHGLTGVTEDGRAHQARVAEHLEKELILVEGRLHSAVMPPVYEITRNKPYNADIDVVTVNAYSLRSPYMDGTSSVTTPWRVFQFDGRDDAIAFAEAWARDASERGLATKADMDAPAFEIVDLGAARSVVPERHVGHYVAELGTYVAHEVPELAGYLDDEGVAGYLACRSAVARGVAIDDAPAMMARISDLVAGVTEAYRANKGKLVFADQMTQTLLRAQDAIHLGSIRYERIEAPAAFGPSEDDIALEGLGIEGWGP